MLFKFLKMFGLDVPANMEAAKASLDLRFEHAKDDFTQASASRMGGSGTSTWHKISSQVSMTGPASASGSGGDRRAFVLFAVFRLRLASAPSSFCRMSSSFRLVSAVRRPAPDRLPASFASSFLSTGSRSALKTNRQRMFTASDFAPVRTAASTDA